MRFPSDEPTTLPASPRRVRAHLLAAGAVGLLSCSTAVWVWGGRGTTDLNLDTAIGIVQQPASSVGRRELAELAIFRHVERSIATLREAATRDDSAGAAARHYLEVLGVK